MVMVIAGKRVLPRCSNRGRNGSRYTIITNHKIDQAFPMSLVSVEKQGRPGYKAKLLPQQNILGNTMLNTGIVYECIV